MIRMTSRVLPVAVALVLAVSLAGTATLSARAEGVDPSDALARVVLALTKTASQPGVALTHATSFTESGIEILQTKEGEMGADGWAMRSTSRFTQDGNVTTSETHWGTDWSRYGDWVSFETLTSPASLRPGSLDRKAVTKAGRVDYVTDLPAEFPGDYDWYPLQVVEPLLFLAQAVSVDSAGDVAVVADGDRTTYTLPMVGVRDTDVVAVTVTVDAATGLVTGSDYFADYGELGAFSSRIMVSSAGADVPLTLQIPVGARTATFSRYARAAGTVLLDKAARMTAQYLNKTFPREVTRQNLADRGTRVAGDYVQTAGNLLTRSTSVFCPENAGSAVDVTYRNSNLVFSTACGWSLIGNVQASVVRVDGRASQRR